MVRALIIILYVPVCVYAFCARLASEVRSALWFAWNDVRIEHDAMRRSWRTNQFTKDDFE
ncbi:MAG: hypothetical protein M9895_00305 [Aquamicrobium sp.]|uniref:hypothetical protein n=1 Tax=Aquamicrobium sp. TaxID=1872579 RepID=UPI00349EBF4E|nr:hypothetical protein [Aquamicrobium sp.]